MREDFFQREPYVVGIKEKIAEIFISSVNGLTPDLNAIYQSSHEEPLEGWTLKQKAYVTASGGGAVAIPVMHTAALVAEAVFVLNRMGTSSFGVGAIKGYGAEFGNILEREDFAAILGYWSGDQEIRETLKGKGVAALSSKVTMKLGTKIAGKAFASGISAQLLASAGYLVGSKIGGKALGEAAATFAGKYAGKYAGGFVPFLGPVLGAGINLWLISSILESAGGFYEDKISFMSTLN
jgi:hypothetical protein